MGRLSPIGVFDSGVGGISVLKEIIKLMPNERYIYYGDSANAPYGVKTDEEVYVLTENVFAAAPTAAACTARLSAPSTPSEWLPSNGMKH